MEQEQRLSNAWRICLEIAAAELGLHPVKGTEAANDTLAAMRSEAKRLGMKAYWKVLREKKLPLRCFPAIVWLEDGSCMLLCRSEEGRILTVNALREVRVWKRQEFENVWSGRMLLLTRRFDWNDLGRELNLSWFVPLLLRYRRYFLEIAAAACCWQVGALAVPLCTQVLIDKVVSQQREETLVVLGIGMTAVVLFRTVMNLIRMYLFAHTAQKMDVILAGRMFRHLLRLPLRFFEVRRNGDVLMRIAALEFIREFITGTALTALLDLLFAGVFIAVMLYYSVPLTLIALAALPLQAALLLWWTPRCQGALREAWDAGAESNAFLVETAAGIETVKTLAVEPQFAARWERLAARSAAANVAKGAADVWLKNSGTFVQKLCIYLVVWYGGWQVMNGRVTIGQFIAFQMLAAQANAPLLRLLGLWQPLQEVRLAMRRIGDILNAAPESTDAACEWANAETTEGAIELRNVSFRYALNEPAVLKNINLQIAAGETIGIVGRSGSGKSTLSKLLQRLYVPESGTLLIDGMDASERPPSWLRSQIGVVSQESFLFNGSIRENIALGRPDAALTRIIQAAQLAGAHEFINELPQGYDTPVGERGGRLSGGQRQRLAIARALLAEPKILLLDEATSALDYRSERQVLDNLAVAAKQQTVLMVAHRLKAVQDCDRILVLENGEMAELGTHQQLMQAKGIYFHLYKQQEC